MTQVPALVRTPLLEAACEISGDPRGGPVLLPHGWPCDVRADDDVVPPLVAAGARVIVPGPSGFGATRFLASGTPRSGPQAALAADALDLLDPWRPARRSWPATTGADGPPASWRPGIRNGSAAWSR